MDFFSHAGEQNLEEEVADHQIVLEVSSWALEAIFAALRETFEVLTENEMKNKLSVGPQELESAIKETRQAYLSLSSEYPQEFSSLCQKPSSDSSLKIRVIQDIKHNTAEKRLDCSIILAASYQELHTIVGSLKSILTEIDEWEFHSRVGKTIDEITSLAGDLEDIAQQEHA